MTNFEKYKDEILEVLKTTNKLAITKDNKIAPCFGTPCDECKLSVPKPCRIVWKEWANSEYIEPKVFTEKEKAFFRVCEKLKYAARDSNGNLYFYTDKPIYSAIGMGGCWTGWKAIFAPTLTNEPFNAIKIEDEEPTSREEILGIKEDNNNGD